MVEITGEYTGELRCVLKHGPSGSIVETDAPADNHGRAERFSPTDMVGAALIACISTTLAILTRDKNWDLTGIKMRVEKHMSTDAPRRIVRLPVEIWMPIELGPGDRSIVEKIVTSCPVHKSIHPDIEAPVKIYWPEE
jgi:uncharacterized OsmC-like protein